MPTDGFHICCAHCDICEYQSSLQMYLSNTFQCKINDSKSHSIHSNCHLNLSGTVTSIAAGIQRYLREDLGKKHICLLKKDQPQFRTFRQALETRRKQLLSAEGVCSTPARTHQLRPEEGPRLWESGTFNTTTANGLIYALYFYNYTLFRIQSHQEHVELQAKQFYVTSDSNGRRYLSYSGRPSQKSANNVKRSLWEEVKYYAESGNPRCPVNVYGTYLSYIPGSGNFYKKPLPCQNGHVCFSSQNLDIQTLSLFRSEIYRNAGIDAGERCAPCQSDTPGGLMNDQSSTWPEGSTTASRIHHGHSFIEHINQNLVGEHINNVTDVTIKHSQGRQCASALEENTLIVTVPRSVTRLVIVKGESKLTLVL